MLTYLLGFHPYQWSLPPLGSAQRIPEKTLDFTLRGCGLGLLHGSLSAYVYTSDERRIPKGSSILRAGLGVFGKTVGYHTAAWGSLALTAGMLGKVRGKDDWKNHAIAGGVFGSIYSRFFAGPSKLDLVVIGGVTAITFACMRISGWVLSPEHLWVRRDADFTDYIPEGRIGSSREARRWWKNKGMPW